MENIKVGKTIKDLRLKKGLSQSEVANICNITAQAVSKWERGESIPDISSLESLSVLYGVSINHIINSNLEVIPSKPRSSYFYQLVILVLALIVFIFPFYHGENYPSGIELIFKGTDGNLVQSLRVTFLVYLGLFVHLVLLILNKIPNNKINLTLSIVLIITTIISNGIAVSQGFIVAESIEFLVGFSIILLIINVYEFIRKLYISRNNVNAIDTKLFVIRVINITMIVYFYAIIHLIHHDRKVWGIDWHLYITIGLIIISIGLHIHMLIKKKYNETITRVVLGLPMIGGTITYLIYMLFIDRHVYTDDLFILLILESIMAVPLVLVVYKQRTR